ncbi:hypothetical protein AAEO56_10630 [Flavobacterium sp. DGU11]|uniref:Uncharacterized protein n=1 Tax=Flavobacterium arundinis TaxID=3139143 RepID=A0ABU9HYT3_9FLAO
MKKILFSGFICLAIGCVSYASDIEDVTKEKSEKKVSSELMSFDGQTVGHCGGTASFINGRGEVAVYNMDPVSADNAVDCNQLFTRWMRDTLNKIGGSVTYYTNLYTDR